MKKHEVIIVIVAALIALAAVSGLSWLLDALGELLGKAARRGR